VGRLFIEGWNCAKKQCLKPGGGNGPRFGGVRVRHKLAPTRKEPNCDRFGPSGPGRVTAWLEADQCLGFVFEGGDMVEPMHRT
jgi:hypothetical protein